MFGLLCGFRRRSSAVLPKEWVSVVNADVGKLSCNRQTADVSRYTLRAGETREYFIPVPINVARLIPSRTQGQSVATDHRCKAAVNQYGG